MIEDMHLNFMPPPPALIDYPSISITCEDIDYYPRISIIPITCETFPMLISFMLEDLFLLGSQDSSFWFQPHPISVGMVALIVLSIAPSDVPPPSLREAWRPGAPIVPRRSRRPGAHGLRGLPLGGGGGEGGEEAGVPNDSPAFQPGEVLARAPLPHYRWGRSPLASLGF